LSERGGCSVCADELEEVRVLEVDGVTVRAQEADGSVVEIAVDFVPGVAVGDHLLVQAGVALARPREVAER